MQILSQLGYHLFATEHTADFLREHGISSSRVNKISSGGEPNVLSLLNGGYIDFIINIPARGMERESTNQKGKFTDGFLIRRKAVDLDIPLITNRQLAEAFVIALEDMKKGKLAAKAWDEYIR